MFAGGGPAAGGGVAGAALAVLPGVPRHGHGGEEEEREGCHGDCRVQTGSYRSYSHRVTLVAGLQQVLVTSDHYLDTDLTCAATQPLLCQNTSPAVTCHLSFIVSHFLCDTN